MITTTSDSQTEILNHIMDLYHRWPIQADLTYSTGRFWTGGLPKPKIRCDINPDLEDLTHVCSVANLPFDCATLDSAVIDLPFIHAHGKASIIGNRFSSIPSQKELDLLHHAAALEAARVLEKNGLLIWKCQDIIESGKPVWNHIKIYEHCVEAGFKAEDLFVLVRKSAIQGHNHAIQQHARRTHSYFWVFLRR